MSLIVLARSLLIAVWLGLLPVAACGGETGTISGRLLSPSGKPVAGALITLPHPDADKPPLATVHSREDGRFRFQLGEMEPRLYAPPLMISAEGLASTYVDKRHIVSFSNADRDLGVIQLSDGRIYSGRIVDASNEPIAGATVAYSVHRFLGRGSSDFIDGPDNVITDDEGRFATPPLADGVPLIRVSANGYASSAFGRSSMQNAADGALGTLRIMPDSPIQGTVVDEDGRPVAGISWQAIDLVGTTDKLGQFALRGMGEAAQAPLSISGQGFTPSFWLVTRTPDGYSCVDITEFQLNPQAMTPAAYQRKMSAPMKMERLTIPLRREGEIHGRALDAETGMPITLSRVVLCNFVRKPGGEVVLSLCRLSQFVQPRPGKFVVGYPVPDEYHLTVSAEGYEDAEAFTPKVSRLERVDGIEVKMKRKGNSPAPVVVTQRIGGAVVGDYEELKHARISLWRLPKKLPAAATRIFRGRTTVGDGFVVNSQMLKERQFSLDVPVQAANWYLRVENPTRILAMHGPCALAKGATLEVNVPTSDAGGVEGIVANTTVTGDQLWVVLFSDLGLQYEAPLRDDGHFEIRDVLPGEYGLKVGSDSLLDTELGALADNPFPTFDESPTESIQLLKRPSKPWKRAIRVKVEPAQTTDVGPVNFER